MISSLHIPPIPGRRSSPFGLIRTMAKEFGFSAKEPSAVAVAGGRTAITWTLVTDEAVECVGVVADIRRESEYSAAFLDNIADLAPILEY